MSKTSIFHKIIFYLSIMVLIDKISSQKSSLIIKEVYPYYMNTTAAFISLNDLLIKKYAYFSFDFSKQNDIAYFKITTESVLSHNNIQFLFTDKNKDEITYNDFEKKYNNWYFIRGSNFKKEKTEQGFDSYLKIERFFKDKKTLLIRLDVEELKGEITLENLESLPEDNKLNKNKHKEKQKENNYHDNYNHNQYNYHKYVINNEQRNYNNDIHNRYYHYHKEWRNHSHDKVNETNSLKIMYGMFIAQVWMIILILYCLVNRRKRNAQYVVTINNSV